ncbi:hypothetical protein BZG35_08405 [Brevundimonas sp. LM2]|uniref:hypothetical protein n=1 Tax=Brevundimonas sp. LM2 TaxID=1938605 RepID=UPI000983975D|nr:hypothetical protein [Brevundimonas sp. LM2]AQR61670.1 hypothetical protein BZG35_08405 [Brevundimonas sp. LM2]
MFDYLEKHCAEAYKREVDQDENVFRSLPFFAATLGVQIAILIPLVARLPAFRLDPYVLVLHGLLGLTGVGVVMTVVFLFIATAQRTFRYPPSETALIVWARAERDTYLQAGFDRADVEAVVADDLRARLAEEFAQAAEHNRAQNLIRLKVRARALAALIAALCLALALAATMFVHDLIVGSGPGATRVTASHTAGVGAAGQERPGQVGAVQADRSAPGVRPAAGRDPGSPGPNPRQPVRDPLPAVSDGGPGD